MLLPDLCNRPTARAPERPIDSVASRCLTASGAQVEVRLTPTLQLRAGLSTLSRYAGEERRTGAAPRCAGVIGRAHRSKPNPLTLSFPERPYAPDRACCAPRVSVGFLGIPEYSCVSLSRLVVLATVLTGAFRAFPVRTQATCPPSRLHVTLDPERLRSSGAACRPLQSPRSSSTTADRPPPRSRLGVGSLAAVAGSRAPFGARPAELLRVRGRRALPALASTSPAIARAGALPQPGWPGHLLSRSSRRHRVVNAFAPAGEAGRHLGPRSPRAAEGLRPSPLREEEIRPRTRGAFHRQTAHGPSQYSTGCSHPVETPA